MGGAPGCWRTWHQRTGEIRPSSLLPTSALSPRWDFYPPCSRQTLPRRCLLPQHNDLLLEGLGKHAANKRIVRNKLRRRIHGNKGADTPDGKTDADAGLGPVPQPRPGEHHGRQKDVTDDAAAAQELVAVQAKHYAVLVTDVEQHPYADPDDPGSLSDPREVRGWPEIVARAILPMRLLGLIFRSFSQINPRMLLLRPSALRGRSSATNAAAAARMAVQQPCSFAGSSAASAASAGVGSEDVVPVIAGPSAAEVVSARVPKEAGELWGIVRAAVRSGQVQRLPSSTR